MRRILRKIAANELENLGDTTTLADPSVVEELKKVTCNHYKTLKLRFFEDNVNRSIKIN